MRSDYNLEEVLKKLRSRSRDVNNFSPIPTDSLPFIEQVVEGLSPITEVRDKGGMSTRLDTPGSVPNKDEQIRQWQDLMRETRPGAEFENELFFRNGPRDQWGYDEFFDKMNEDPNAMADISYLEGMENPDTLMPLRELETLEEVKSKFDKELERIEKETYRKPKKGSDEDLKLIEEVEKVASILHLAQKGEAAGTDVEGGGDPFAELLGGGEGDLGLGGGIEDLLGGDEGSGVGKEKGKKEDESPQLLTDINPQILENLDEQSKRSLVKAVSDLKVLLSTPIDSISTSQLKAVFNNILSLVSKAKERFREKVVGSEPEFDKSRLENANKYVGASYVPRRLHPDTYYLINAYNELAKLGVKINSIYVIDKSVNDGTIKISATIEYYRPTPMQSDAFKSKLIPLIVIYDAIKDKPVKLSTLGGRELEFTKEAMQQLIEENKYPVDFFFGYYNPQFMKKKKS
jgi:hypothetical protein